MDEAINKIQVTFPDEVIPKGLDAARKWQLYDDIRPFVYHHNSDSINVKDCGMYTLLFRFAVSINLPVKVRTLYKQDTSLNRTL